MASIRALIFDVDDTLMPFANIHHFGVQAVKEKSLEFLGDEEAERFCACFDNNYRLLQRRHNNQLTQAETEGLENLLAQMAEMQTSWPEEYGLKIWSREIHAKAASIDTGAPVSGQQAVELAQAYWAAIAANASPHPGVKDAMEKLDALDKRIFLLTGSDTRVTFDAGTSQFIYDPEYSSRKKLERIMLLREKFGLPFDGVQTADPYDKPHEHSFRLVLESIGKLGIEPSEVAMVGDSYSSDLAPALGLGIGRLYLVDWNGKFNSSPKDGVDLIRDFGSLGDLG